MVVISFYLRLFGAGFARGFQKITALVLTRAGNCGIIALATEQNVCSRSRLALIDNHQPDESLVVISFYLRLLNRSNKFDNNAPSDEALRVMICIASPRSSRNTFSISTSLSPSFHSLRYSYRENCSEGDIHLALPAPQRHGFTGIIVYWGGICNGFSKNNRRCT